MVRIGDMNVIDAVRSGTAEMNRQRTATTKNVILRTGTRNV